MNQELKRQIVQKGLEKVLDDAKVPQRYHLKVVEALHAAIKAHKDDISSYESQNKRHETHNLAHERQIAEWDKLSKKLTSIDHLKGDKGDKGNDGEDGISPDVNEVIASVLKKIRIPRDGMDGRPGKDAKVDEEKIIGLLVEKIKKDKPFDLSHIRNAQSFIKDGIRYKFEELMKGGGSTGGSGSTILTASGAVNGVNTSFVFTQKPNQIVSDGVAYRVNHGWTWSAPTATMSQPPSFDIYGLT